jgi:hypothetical protein
MNNDRREEGHGNAGEWAGLDHNDSVANHGSLPRDESSAWSIHSTNTAAKVLRPVENSPAAIYTAVPSIGIPRASCTVGEPVSQSMPPQGAPIWDLEPSHTQIRIVEARLRPQTL